jgi:lipopolysaccharide export system protein LptA
MRLSIQRLRWVLLAGALLLVVVLAAYISYGRYRALKAYRQILAHSGITLTHDSNGVTYSQSVKGRKVFTIRAKKESSLGNGKWALHDAEMLLYNRTGDSADHIYGSEMEYDENEGVARANGEIFMDLQPPQGLANGGHAPGDAGGPTAPIKTKPVTPPPIIHVRTSGLVYVRKLGVAATDQQVDFSYGDMRCTARGAEFNSGESTLHLLANVHMDGLAHGKPLHVTATRADLDRNSNTAKLAHPIVTSNGRSAKADTAILNLRKDGSIEHVQGIDHVLLTSETQQIASNHLDAVLNLQSILQSARIAEDVVLVDTNPLRPAHGSANLLDIAFNNQGSPTNVVATGAAKLSMLDRKSNPRGLLRSMDGATIVALFAPSERNSPARITEIHAIGSAHAAGQSDATPPKGAIVDKTKPVLLKNIQISADDLRILFTNSAEHKSQPQQLYGTGHTFLQQDAPLGEQETSSGDSLELTFAATDRRTDPATPDAAAMNIASAVQTGHVEIHDHAAAKPGSSTSVPVSPGIVSSGTADRAIYNGATQVLTLTGDAHLYGDNASLIAPTVSLNQSTLDAAASGGVQTTFQNADTKMRGSATPASPAPAPMTHVLSASAHFDHATQLANFYGTDAQPARMWQNGSQVQAATLLFDGTKRTFSARPAKSGSLIHAIFASNPATPRTDTSPKAASIIRVASPKMDYNDLKREVTFSDGVTIDGTMGEVRGQRAAVLLLPATAPLTDKREPSAALEPRPSPLNGSVDRIVVYGAVQLDQPGRHGTGEQLLYTAARGTYILTGTPTAPPHIVDAQQGNVTGATLRFGDAGSTIVVAGDPAAPKGKGGRVRTETHVNPGKEERQ